MVDTEINGHVEQRHVPSTNPMNSISEKTNALTERITELFHFCDVENRGYVTKQDLYRLKDELDLDERDVDNAFLQLDTNHDNFLSLEEFTTGFGLFIGVEQQPALGITSKTPHPDDDVEDESARKIKVDFSFQVFNLIDKDDKGHINKQDLIEASDTLEIDDSQINYLYSRLRSSSGVIYFDDFVNNIGSIVALSPALQEIKEHEDELREESQKRKIIARFVFILSLNFNHSFNAFLFAFYEWKYSIRICTFFYKNLTYKNIQSFVQNLRTS